MKLKKRMLIGLTGVLLCAAAVVVYMLSVRVGGSLPSFDAAGVSTPFEARAGRLYRAQAGEMQPFELRGTVCADGAEEQFELMADMNLNTVMAAADAPDEFYRALAAFNEKREQPLYLLQSVAYGSDASYRAAVDRLQRLGVGQWVLGYALSAREFGGQTGGYAGACLSAAEGASQRESALARAGDVLLTHESAVCGVQRLIALVGSPETEDVNFERILCGETVRSGLFALYCVREQENLFERRAYYRDWYDEHGQSDPYRAYLIELCDRHEMPVVISGLNVPVSRGAAYGAVSEREQAQRMTAQYEDAVRAGCAGVLLSNWQDEWTLWCDAENPEQTAGVIALEAGGGQTVCRVDGVMADWEQVPLLTQGEGLLLQAQYDAQYVYFRVYAEGWNAAEEEVYLFADVRSDVGAPMQAEIGIPWMEGADAAIILAGGERSRLLTREGAQALKHTQEDFDTGDFALRGSGAEIRIAWRRLGFENPAECMVRGADNQAVKTDMLRAAAVRADGTCSGIGELPLQGWNEVQTHIRLREAYYALRDAFGSEKGE